MLLGFPLGCSLVVLLLFSSAGCRPMSESGNKYPYAWGYRPRLLPDAASGLQLAQQRNPGPVQSNASPGASSSQDHAPAGAKSVHPPEVPVIFPRSGAHINNAVASGSRVPASSGSSQSVPRMVADRSQATPRGSGDEKPSSGDLQMLPPQSGDLLMMAMALAQSQSAPSRNPNMGPAAPYLFPGSYPGAPPQSFSQARQQMPPVPGPPKPPPVYIIQSSNGFMHLSRKNSRSKYSPEYLEGLADGGDPFAFLAASDPRGGLKV